MRKTHRRSSGKAVEEENVKETTPIKEVMPMIQAGKKAPDFSAPAYQHGKFPSLKL